MENPSICDVHITVHNNKHPRPFPPAIVSRNENLRSEYWFLSATESYMVALICIPNNGIDNLVQDNLGILIGMTCLMVWTTHQPGEVDARNIFWYDDGYYRRFRLMSSSVIQVHKIRDNVTFPVEQRILIQWTWFGCNSGQLNFLQIIANIRVYIQFPFIGRLTSHLGTGVSFLARTRESSKIGSIFKHSASCIAGIPDVLFNDFLSHLDMDNESSVHLKLSLFVALLHPIHPETWCVSQASNSLHTLWRK